MTLDANEFIRRFLIHVLPDGFHRIRHYGLFANANRANNIAGCSPYPTQLRRAGRAITPKMVATTKTGMLALAAAGSSSRPSNPVASPASGPSPRSGSIAHEQHPVATAPIALPVRRRYPAGNSHTLLMAPSASTLAAKTQILQHAGSRPTARTPTKITDPATHSSRQLRPRAAKSRRTSP